MIGIIDSGQKIVIDGLFRSIDAAQLRSYPGTGVSITELIRNVSKADGLINGVTFDSEFGGNFVLDGTNDRVTYFTGFSWPPAEPLNNFTMEIWFRPTTTHQIDTQSTSGTSGLSGQRYILPAIYGPGSTAGAGISAGTNGISVYEHSGGYMPALLVWSGTLSTVYFTHAVITYTNKQTRLYVNGTLVKTGLTSTKTVFPSYDTIGTGDYGAFPGRVSLYSIYNRPLTATEVLQNYNAIKSRFGL